MEYLKKDIAQILDKPARTIMYWTDCGSVSPDIYPSQGKGKARVYSERNLVEFAMTDILSKDHDVSLKVIGDIFQRIHKEKLWLKKTGENLFETFFSDPNWCESHEMVFIGDKRKPGPFKLEIIPQGASYTDLTNLYHNFFSDDNYVEFSTLLLGRIKTIAFKKYRLS